MSSNGVVRDLGFILSSIADLDINFSSEVLVSTDNRLDCKLGVVIGLGDYSYVANFNLKELDDSLKMAVQQPDSNDKKSKMAYLFLRDCHSHMDRVLSEYANSHSLSLFPDVIVKYK